MPCMWGKGKHRAAEMEPKLVAVAGRGNKHGVEVEWITRIVCIYEGSLHFASLLNKRRGLSRNNFSEVGRRYGWGGLGFVLGQDCGGRTAL